MPSLFRVENPLSRIGLWYDAEGNFTEFIKTIDNAQCADLPMDFDPEIAGGWSSACDNLPDMKHWFSASDLAALQEIGYGLYEIEVDDYRTYNGHAVFYREKATKFTPRPITLLE